MNRNSCIGVILAGLLVPATMGAQQISIGETVSVQSELLGENRRLMIFLPESYSSSSFSYPVLYLLDGEPEFLHTAGVVEFLAGTDQIPELIVVGVTNTNRSRDLTPPSADEEETAFWDEVGGADRFRQFFREELIPFIDGHYRTVPYRIIRGQSFGGLFAIHDYMSQEPAFHAYLTSSAAVGWNFDELIQRVPEFFGSGPLAPLYIASAGRDFPGNLDAIRRFVTLLEQAQQKSGWWRHEHFPDERHYSLVHRSTYSGLRFLYKNWQPPEAVAERGSFDEYENHYAALSKDFGYEIKIPMWTVIRLGNQLLRERRYEEGLRIKLHNIELYPEQPESYWHVGDAYMLASRPEEAKPYFERAYEKAIAMTVPDLDDYRQSVEALEE